MDELEFTPKSWTVEEYEELAQFDFFDGKPRVELLEGQIVEMSPQNLPHSRTIVTTSGCNAPC